MRYSFMTFSTPDLGLRNILAHGYAVVDDTVVWSAVTERIPALLADVTELLAEIE